MGGPRCQEVEVSHAAASEADKTCHPCSIHARLLARLLSHLIGYGWNTECARLGRCKLHKFLRGTISVESADLRNTAAPEAGALYRMNTHCGHQTGITA